MRKWIACAAILTLSACGADGPPFVPSASGNVTVGTGGVQTNTTLGASNGTINFGLTL